MPRRQIQLIAALLTLLLISAAKQTQTLTGRIVGVSDGDTVTLLDPNKVQIRIRLEGIDASESGQAFGQKAKQALSQKVFGKDVLILWRDTDKYGRTLGHIYIGEDWINLQLLEEGWAWHFKKYNQKRRLAEAEQKARDSKLGLWADSNSIPPWQYRDQDEERRLARKKNRKGTKANETSRPAPQAVASIQAEPAVQAETVYVTKTGSKYHRAGCRHLARSQIPISLDDARRSYSPCSVCNPPD